MRHHDLIVIGTGSGNSFLDRRFHGWDVGLVEHGVFGGTCLNVGCIPTKMYVFPADIARLAQRAGKLGIDASIDKVRWPDIRDRVFGRIDPLSAGGRAHRVDRSPNITVYFGHAEFTGPREMSVARTDGSGVDEISADRIAVVAGSRPSIPPVVAESGVPFETSDTVMRLDALPRHLIILGSGYISAEFAHVFSAFGSEVSVIGRGDRLMRKADEAISARFTELAQGRWDVHLGHGVAAVRGGRGDIEVELEDGSLVRGDVLLVATGRVPNGDRMNLPAAGIRTHDDGRIAVDEQQRTSVEGVFAAGDVSSAHQLKHVANHETRTLAHNLLHPDELTSSDHRFVPSAVFTDPQIASVGRTEAQCRAEGLDITVKVQTYADIAYGWAMEDTIGFCKLIAERGTGKLLGAHIIGAQASALIQPLIQAMSFGLDAHTMARGQYWIHPALPELVENALLGLDVQRPDV